ncbi:MAG: hypothetical protein F4Y47_12575 [Acidobacteriia bacterium]|nr:hypothetical protein [Terriglobia bacterium]MYG03476.1 hypothetical protein [Terriglobia bacterium]MYK09409.1 hypothetical protein [Terriglobia bacterium]
MLADFVTASDIAAFAPGIRAGIRTNPLASGGAVLRDQYAASQADFQAYFPSLAEHARPLAAAG